MSKIEREIDIEEYAHGGSPLEWEEEWYCGAFEPPKLERAAFRCTEPYGHEPDHRAVVDGVLVAQWPRHDERTDTREDPTS